MCEAAQGASGRGGDARNDAIGEGSSLERFQAVLEASIREHVHSFHPMWLKFESEQIKLAQVCTHVGVLRLSFQASLSFWVSV